RRLRLERVRRGGDRQPRLVRETSAHARSELRVRVQACARRGSSERNLAEALEGCADAVVSLADLRRVAAELLAERDRNRVHQVRAAGLDDVVELRRLR